MTTIKDVARKADVSVTTASYALNRNGTISEATRRRVLEAAEELNYTPNAFARNLKRRKSGTLGVFISRFGGSFYEEILEGIHDAVLRTDYELIVCPESKLPRKLLLHRQVDGAIIFDSKVKNEDVLRLASRGFPMVVLDRNLKADCLLPLLVDNQQGVREAFYHLYNQGARKLSFISGALDSFDNQERMDTFLEEANNHGLSVQCYYGNFTEQSGYLIAEEMFRNRELPEAVFCANDQMALGFLRAMKAANLRAPSDIAVVGFDDIQISKYFQPSLSTIGASRFEWGALAATQLISYLEENRPFRPERIRTTFIPRESSRLVHIEMVQK